MFLTLMKGTIRRNDELHNILAVVNFIKYARFYMLIFGAIFGSFLEKNQNVKENQ